MRPAATFYSPIATMDLYTPIWQDVKFSRARIQESSRHSAAFILPIHPPPSDLCYSLMQLLWANVKQGTPVLHARQGCPAPREVVREGRRTCRDRALALASRLDIPLALCHARAPYRIADKACPALRLVWSNLFSRHDEAHKGAIVQPDQANNKANCNHISDTHCIGVRFTECACASCW